MENNIFVIEFKPPKSWGWPIGSELKGIFRGKTKDEAINSFLQNWKNMKNEEPPIVVNAYKWTPLDIVILFLT